ILQTALNTRVLPTGNFRYVRSDYPGKLTDDEVRWLYQNDITTIVDLREKWIFTAIMMEIFADFCCSTLNELLLWSILTFQLY
ncbi:MAG: tyrosine-protein phosphatase, partial [Lachnospiraceae bacterium]|nr:tyrosine-protein phosphatase [Lachnospiraceae bacterium]